MFIPITLGTILWCIFKQHIPKQIGKTYFNNNYLFLNNIVGVGYSKFDFRTAK